MKLIIERDGVSIYAYMEKEKYHKKMEKERKGKKRLDTSLLDKECNLDYIMEEGYFVFDIKK